MDARAIVRDVIGSVPEAPARKQRASHFSGSLPLSTIDDSVLTVAATEWMLAGQSLVDLLHAYTDTYPNGDTAVFATGPVPPSQNLTTALAMAPLCGRAPVAFETIIEEVHTWSKRSSEITHNHFEGIRGARATLHAEVPTRIDKTDHRVLVRASPIRTRTSLRF